ncbi:NAD(P)H-binding protein [Streptomyces sp. NPDC058459]|uniref:NAD(P)H-binding protein n=1 Tax=Streptomyces sp. NPDC058459 TaxID=3346508 RepID=UPI0036574306
MIVVSAASGAFGRLVVDRLLERCPADLVTAAVRDPGKAADLAARGVRVRPGDYDVPKTLRTVFEGADRLLLISSPELDPARRAAQHRAAVDAAVDAGVGSIVYTSFLGAGTQSDGVTAAHHATERGLHRHFAGPSRSAGYGSFVLPTKNESADLICHRRLCSQSAPCSAARTSK